MPRMREATRSGWNASSASVFSPTPTNFSGWPVTERMESAAPPRASPSILVRMTPVMPEPLVELIGRFHRVLAGHGVRDEQNLGRIQRFLQLLQLLHQLFVDMQAAGGVDQQDVAPGLHRFAAGGSRQIERLRFFRRALVNGNVAPAWPEC